MNNLIKQIIESKFNFNIDDLHNVSKADDKLLLSGNKPMSMTQKDIYNMFNKCNLDLDSLTADEMQYLQDNIESIKSISKENQIKVKDEKDLRFNILYRYNNLYKPGEVLNLNDLDVSNIEDFSKVFKDIKKCTINACLWDTSKARYMKYAFCSCKKSTKIYANFWNLSNVVDMTGLFYKCGGDIRIDLSSTSKKLRDIHNMFEYCNVDSILKLAINLHTGGVYNMSLCFHNSSFNYDISHWDVSSANNLLNMFSGCPFNKDISKWNLNGFDYKLVIPTKLYWLNSYTNISEYDKVSYYLYGLKDWELPMSWENIYHRPERYIPDKIRGINC